MGAFSTKMQLEAIEFPSIVEHHIKEQRVIENTVTLLKHSQFSYVCTLARGSSNHAALFAKYLIENHLQKFVCSFSPSICTLYKSPMNFNSLLMISVSQSGSSDDLVHSLLYAKQFGATTLSFVNDVKSPLSIHSQYLIPLGAGAEQSVAATKSFLASLSRLIQFINVWKNEQPLQQAYLLLPEALRNVIASYSWDQFLPHLKKTDSMFVLGRGYGFPIACEAALKLKETCAIHAEGLSGAEILHGPFELVDNKFCVFVFLQEDETLSSMLVLLGRLAEKKTRVFVVGTEDVLSQVSENNFHFLPTAKKSLHPVLDLVIAIQCFYLFVGNLALIRRRDPDNPKNLKKITRTF